MMASGTRAKMRDDDAGNSRSMVFEETSVSAELGADSATWRARQDFEVDVGT